MKKDIVKGLVINNFFMLLTSILKLNINKLFIMYIGITELGLMKLFSNLVGYITLVEVGLGSAAAFALYKPLAEKNDEKIKAVLYTINKLYLYISLAILILGSLASFLLPIMIKNDTFSNIIYVYWILYIFCAAFNYFAVKYSIILTADQNYNQVAFVRGLTLLISQIAQMISVAYFHSMIIYIISMFIDMLLSYIILKAYFNKNYSHLVDKVKKNIQLKWVF